MQDCCEIPRDYYGLQSQSQNKLSLLVGTHIENLHWGKRCSEVRPDISDLLHYMDVLDFERVRIGFGLPPCLNDAEYMALSGIIKQKTFECVIKEQAMVVERDGMEAWVRSNPRCVAFELWERYNYIIFDDLTFDFRAEEHQRCNLAFDIASERINCELVASITAFTHNCDTTLQVSSVEQVCRQTLYVISSEYPDCGLSLEVVSAAHYCGIDLEMIRKVYGSGCELVLEAGVVSFKTETSCYPILDFFRKS